MPVTDGSTALKADHMVFDLDTAAVANRGYGPVSGILVAVGGSLLLWAALAQVARWIAHTVM
jgi:hypothetical protein